VSPLIVAALFVAVLVIGFGIHDTFSFKQSEWQSAGRSRGHWIALFLGFGPLAVLLYWGTVRYQLRFPERYETVDGVAPADRL